MRAELVVKGRSLTGVSDLTLVAPIIPGLVPSLDAITYKTRIKRLLQTLQGGRASLHEYAAWRPLSDAVERVAKIHSFRVVVLEDSDQVMLAVTFDGTWEAYIRVLWQKVGTLLDIIFCNTQGYVLSTESFEQWTGWVSRVQVETRFFFHTHGLTVEDVPVLREQERLQRCAGPSAATRELDAVRATVPSPEEIAWNLAQRTDENSEAIRQGLQSLSVLFRLTDLYLPGTPDGAVLQRAARDLLVEFIPFLGNPDLLTKMQYRFGRQIAWLQRDVPRGVFAPRELPPLPEFAPIDEAAGDVQGGILNSLDGVTHGCLLLLAVDTPAAAADLLQRLIPRIEATAATTDAAAVSAGKATAVAGELLTNLGITYEGLRVLGFDDAMPTWSADWQPHDKPRLAWLPQEFREGMEARASMLGDFRTNHPRRWRLPRPNWERLHARGLPEVSLTGVHLVVQLRIAADKALPEDPNDPGNPLHATIRALVEAPESTDQAAVAIDGLRLLAVQSMRRTSDDGREHFGFVDGGSDPVFNRAQAGHKYPNQVQLGEVLVGYASGADVAPNPNSPEARARLSWLRNGSFLVVRKLRQQVDVLERAVQALVATSPSLTREAVLAKMMGRELDGMPLADPSAGIGNDFNYEGDKQGSNCPFHAHIRRVNPRIVPPAEPAKSAPVAPGARQPRLLRRGMPYGPAFVRPATGHDVKDDGQDRGLVFMAYNASISEQFEVVQRWITGGNSSGGFSGQSDPFLGVPDVNQQRHFRFEQGGEVHRMALDRSPGVTQEPQPFVRLEWGMYLFVPSVSALKAFQALADAAAHATPAVQWSVPAGQDMIDALQRAPGSAAEAVDAWKAALEDPLAQEKYRSASVWAAVRQAPKGVLKTPYGVLVAGRDEVMRILQDTTGDFSVQGQPRADGSLAEGYRERMRPSIGEIFLGQDKTGPGDMVKPSREINQAIFAIQEREAFELARGATERALDTFVAQEQQLAKDLGKPRWELNLDAKEVCDKVLASLCQHWFGLPKVGTDIVPGSWRWDWGEDGPEPALYPSQFTAPSRCIFQPHPSKEVRDYGARYGRGVTDGLAAFLRRLNGRPPTNPEGDPAPLTAAVLKAFADPSQAASTLAGVLMGFLPTVDGNLRLSLNEWLRDGTFWSLRDAWSNATDADLFERANALLRRPLTDAMQLRPSPELVWRLAARDGVQVGDETLARGDLVVVALVSATQQSLEHAGSPDVMPIFGGAFDPDDQRTHACPGYKAAMGVMLGVLSGLVAVKHTLRPTPVPLAFTFEGPVAAPATAAPATKAAAA